MPEELECRTCHETKPRDQFYWKGGSRSDPHCKRCRSLRVQEGRRARKAAVYARLGDACYCCGETDHRFLGIDHKDDDGAEHRRSLNNIGGRLFVWLYGRPEEDHRFQLACHNCNLGRHINGGICPHQDARAET